jgi:tRNA(Ile)-lysidine synthase
MPGPHPATAAIRSAVRSALADCSPGAVVLVALSGGADSTALAAAAAFESRAAGVRVGAVVVDHGLQESSAAVADAAAQVARTLVIDPLEVVRVEVAPAADGVEAAARTARYAAIDAVAHRFSARLILLGHTLDDQAEQVLLGLTRGSGTRSLSGMPPARDRFRRPLLGVTREQTRASCEAEGLTWWDDPMNEDTAYLRVRARRALADLERDLGPGIAAALARSADQLREDADHLDALADAFLSGWRSSERLRMSPNTSTRQASVPVADLDALPRAVRTRVWRRLLIAAGAPSGQVSARHTDECDRLLTHWRGQGPLHVPGDLRVTRAEGMVSIRRG